MSSKPTLLSMARTSKWVWRFDQNFEKYRLYKKDAPKPTSITASKRWTARGYRYFVCDGVTVITGDAYSLADAKLAGESYATENLG